MKDFFARILFVISDVLLIAISLYLAFHTRNTLSFHISHQIPLEQYLLFYPIYLITIIIFFYEGIYTHRYDFWHESRLVLKSIFLSSLLTFSYLGFTKTIDHYSRFVILASFFIAALLIPAGKNILKKLLYRFGLWQKEAQIYGNDQFLTEEIYGNPYLGYIRPKNRGISPATVFLNSKGSSPEKLKSLLLDLIRSKKEVIFIPLIDDYDLTHSHIYELSNTRTNLIVYQNRLKSRYRQILQQSYNYLLALLLLPIIIPFGLLIAIAIRIESPGPIFFIHKRIGRHGKAIQIYKFRTMYTDAKERLEELISNDPAIKKEWEESFKLKNDPRITKVGKFLRLTSLDEIPQIFNVLKGTMNFVGPRPVVKEEIEKYYLDDAEYYYMVKPGITGLWQISGRSDTDYAIRVYLDKWYVLNWSLWLDIYILLKTIKVVLLRKGAY